MAEVHCNVIQRDYKVCCRIITGSIKYDDGAPLLIATSMVSDQLYFGDPPGGSYKAVGRTSCTFTICFICQQKKGKTNKIIWHLTK
jgi:hypothetical protein